MDKNTFGNYNFEEWVPLDIQGQIREFWGWAGRTHKDWLSNNTYEKEHHFYGANGFGLPPNGSLAIFFLREKLGEEYIYKRFEGRYLHAWNNIGRLVLEEHERGEYKVVSSCDAWIRRYE
jgi:hypothetical protein